MLSNRTVAGISLHREQPLNSTTLILMALDVNFALAVLLLCGIFLDSNPVSLLQQYPWLLVLPVSLPLFFHVGGTYNLRRKWLSPASWLQTLLVVVTAVLSFVVFDQLIVGSGNLWWVFLALGVAMTAEVVVARSVTAVKDARARSVQAVLVVGTDWAASQVIDTVVREPRLRLRVVGMINGDREKRHYAYKGVRVVGGRESLTRVAQENDVKLVVTAGPKSQSPEMLEELFALKSSGVRIVDMPNFYEMATGQVPIKHVGNSWFLYAGGFELLHKVWLQRVKRCFDIVASLAGIALSLPLMVLSALAVKCESRGAVFFRQDRVGQNEKVFRLIKFRTMRENAEEGTGPVWASVDDSRVTRLGRWMRKTRIDELPQFFNVLSGDMSFIGPRPERPFFVEKLKEGIPYYAFRFTVRPGLSGWAQVNYPYGASTEDAVEKLKFELYYIKNMSLWLDGVIAVKTLKVVLLARGT